MSEFSAVRLRYMSLFSRGLGLADQVNHECSRCRCVTPSLEDHGKRVMHRKLALRALAFHRLP